MNKIFNAIKRNTVLKIFAFVIAILLWFYVQIIQNPEVSYGNLEIPVTIIGEAAINSEGFIVASLPKNMKTNITVSTKRSKIKFIDASMLQATIDVSTVSDSGDQPFTIRVRSDDYEVTVVNKSPETLSLTIDKIITDVRPVKISYNGNLDPSYYIDKDNVIITPEKATVKIPSLIADAVSDVLIDVNMSNTTSNIEKKFTGILIDNDGEEVQNTYASIATEEIMVSIPVLKKKTVPISLKDTPDNVHFDLSSVQVEVAGEERLIDRLTYIEGYIENYSDTETIYEVILRLENLLQIDKQDITAKVIGFVSDTTEPE